LKRSLTPARSKISVVGECILHGAPEWAAGGPVGVIRTGDMIVLDAHARQLHVEISDTELAQRLETFVSQVAPSTRGWEALYIEHVLGADLDFLQGRSGSVPARHSH
jgi:dihydroxy-acid dehydratase